MIAATVEDYRLGMVVGGTLVGGIVAAIAVCVDVHRAERRIRDHRQQLEALGRACQKGGRR